MNDIVIKDNPSQTVYQELTFTLAASERRDIFWVYNYFRVLTLSAQTLAVQFGENAQNSNILNAGIGLECADAFSRVTLINTNSGGTVTVTIALALGKIWDNRLTVSGTVSITGIVQTSASPMLNANSSQVAVNNVATQLIVASASNGICTVYAGDTDLFVGNANTVTTGNGFKIPAGESHAFGAGSSPYQGNLWGIRAGATAVTAYVMKEGF